MKRIICITGIILIACVITGAVVEESTVTDVKYTLTSRTENTESIPIYVIKEENGLLTVYRKGEDSPYMTTETQISNLPKSDMDILKKGIEVYGETQLRKALEDYCS